MMLEWAGKTEEAMSIDKAVDNVLTQHITTPDLGGRYSTQDVGEAIARLV